MGGKTRAIAAPKRTAKKGDRTRARLEAKNTSLVRQPPPAIKQTVATCVLSPNSAMKTLVKMGSITDRSITVLPKAVNCGIAGQSFASKLSGG